MLENNESLRQYLYLTYSCTENELQTQFNRCNSIYDGFEKIFGHYPDYFFSAPGRVEIIGNHTDHNGGLVIAAGINLDMIAAMAPNTSGKINVFSLGYSEEIVSLDLTDLSVKENERNSTISLLRGIVARFEYLGYKAGGFDAYVSSDVMMGSGLSSSAAFEVLFGTILNIYYNQGAISPVEIAQIGQYAENVYFGKPCGLMDQMASAIGGFVMIDFKDKAKPYYEKIDVDFQSSNYSLLIVDIKSDHQNLTADYASIPEEMMAVCQIFDARQCRDINPESFLARISNLREKAGDRAVLRCLHFFDENKRVTALKKSLGENDFATFLKLINESGDSSFRWLQNCHSPRYPDNQGISLGIYLTQCFLREQNLKGACRVHGGGFAGSIEVFMSNSHLENYRKYIEAVFGTGAVKVLKVRPIGVCYYRIQ